MITVATIGFDQYLNRIKTASKELQAEVAAEIKLGAEMYRDGAKRDLVANGTSNTSDLLNKINIEPVTLFEYNVKASSFHAPFIEFGTKGKYKPIPGTEDIAAQFRVKMPGTFDKLVENIKVWMKKRGVGVTYNIKTRRKTRQTKDEKDKVAFAIAMSIAKNGISPQPYFFKQITPVRNHVNKRIESILNGL